MPARASGKQRLEVPPDTPAVRALATAEAPTAVHFPVNSWLGRLDDAVTDALAHLPVEPPLPFPTTSALLFLVGHVFGASALAFGAAPALFVLALQDFGAAPLVTRVYVACAAVAVVVVLAAVAAGHVNYKGLSEGGAPVLGLLASLVGLWSLPARSAPTPAPLPLHVLALFIASWLVTIVLIALLKVHFSRPRPAHRRRCTVEPPSPAASGFPRQAHVWAATVGQHAAGGNAWHSFPSFDTAGSACVPGALFTAFMVHAMTPPSMTDDEQAAATAAPTLGGAALFALGAVPWWAWLVVALTAYSRVYFMAHHVLDTIVGALMGFSICVAVGVPEAALRGSGTLSFASTVVWMVPFVLMVVLLLSPGDERRSARPVYALVAAGALLRWIGLLPPFSFTALCVVAVMGAATGAVFVAHCMTANPWCIRTVCSLLDQLQDPPFDDAVQAMLACKRREFKDGCAAGSWTFPASFRVFWGLLTPSRQHILTWNDVREVRLWCGCGFVWSVVCGFVWSVVRTAQLLRYVPTLPGHRSCGAAWTGCATTWASTWTTSTWCWAFFPAVASLHRLWAKCWTAL